MKISYLFTLITLIVFGFISCDNNSAENAETTVTTETQNVDPAIVDNPMTASEQTTSNEKLPQITFAEESFDFGKIKQGDVVDHQFKFKNTGKSDLIITSASGSCGCTVPDWPKNPIPPGEEGKIDVQFNSAGKSGMQRVTVTLVANTIPNTKVLTVTGEVQTPN